MAGEVKEVNNISTAFYGNHLMSQISKFTELCCHILTQCTVFHSRSKRLEIFVSLLQTFEKPDKLFLNNVTSIELSLQMQNIQSKSEKSTCCITKQRFYQILRIVGDSKFSLSYTLVGKIKRSGMEFCKKLENFSRFFEILRN